METAQMAKTAKIFMTGRSQAVRLPKEFRFNGDEVSVRRDEFTGELILSELTNKTGNWDDFFELLDSIEIPEDFLNDRDQSFTPARDPFE
jgi:antitoxin VapB